MIKVGIIGSTGYAGQEIVRLILNHKDDLYLLSKNDALLIPIP